MNCVRHHGLHRPVQLSALRSVTFIDEHKLVADGSAWLRLSFLRDLFRSARSRPLSRSRVQDERGQLDHCGLETQVR